MLKELFYIRSQNIIKLLIIALYCSVPIIWCVFIWMNNYGIYSQGYYQTELENNDSYYNINYNQSHNHNQSDNHNHRGALNNGYTQLPQISDLSLYTSNLSNQSIAQLIQPRSRPGNPRPRQVTINTYGKFESDDAPDFETNDFQWAYFGFDSIDNKYKGLFKNTRSKSTVSDIKNRLNISSNINITKLTMQQRANEISFINDNYSDIIEVYPENNPLPKSKNSDKDATRAIIEQALVDNISPEQFRLDNPEICSIKTNKIWYKNAYDSKVKEKEKLEQKEAVEWLDSKLNNMQKQLINIIEKEDKEYNDKYDTNSKKILMGNRNIIVIISPDGGKGLTTTFKFIKMKFGEDQVMTISSGGKVTDIICNYHSQLEKCTNCKYLFWNIPREGYNNFRWEVVEQICDALTTNNKYLSMTQSKAPPTFVIGTNTMFELRSKVTKRPLITLDRIIMYRVRSSVNALARVDTFDYYLKKYKEDPRKPRISEEDGSDFELSQL